MSISVEIKDNATPAVEALGQELDTTRLNPALGAAVTALFQRHLIRNPSNAQGWPSTNFWAQAARATNYQALPEGVVVSVNKIGVRQRYQGGPIDPVNASFLTIPAQPEAYGKSAREFFDLVPVFFKKNDGGGRSFGALVVAQQSKLSLGKKRKDGTRKMSLEETGGAVMFWLVKHVEQQGDKSVIPDDDEIGRTVASTVGSAVARALRRNSTEGNA
jgi:hypothetical protein